MEALCLALLSGIQELGSALRECCGNPRSGQSSCRLLVRSGKVFVIVSDETPLVRIFSPFQGASMEEPNNDYMLKRGGDMGNFGSSP